jgi:hypothetical protein
LRKKRSINKNDCKALKFISYSLFFIEKKHVPERDKFGRNKNIFRIIACLGELKRYSGKLQVWENKKHIPESSMFGRIKNMFRKETSLGEIKTFSGLLHVWEN